MDQSLQGAASAVRTIALQMLEEGGRWAVLVGVARLDAALESLLQTVLVPVPGATDTFFQPDRPLGSFGARITLAAELGLIEPAVEQALKTLQRVRNAFAHPPCCLARGVSMASRSGENETQAIAGVAAHPQGPDEARSQPCRCP